MLTTRQPDSKKGGAKGSKQPPVPVGESPAPAVDEPAGIQTDAKGSKEPAVAVAESPTPVSDQTTEVQNGVQPAYLKYVDARKRLSDAFRGRQRRDREAYEEAQRRYREYEQAIDNAVRTRQKAEREAMAIYKAAVESAVDKASEEYHARMRLALMRCKKTTEDAWKASLETSTEMAGIFEKDQVIPERHEKPGDSGQPARFGTSLQDDVRTLKDGCVSFVRRASGAVTRATGQGFHAVVSAVRRGYDAVARTVRRRGKSGSNTAGAGS